MTKITQRRRRILCWSDSALAGTGFGVVSKHVLRALHNTGKYDIHHLAINFTGDFVDRDEVPWQQQPAKLLDPRDPHGMKMFLKTLAKGDYDLVWVCNDLYVTNEIVQGLQQVRQALLHDGKKVPLFVYYYPVDCSVPSEGSGFLKEVHAPVCYTDHGREETLRTFPGVEPRLRQIPHGVDSKAYYPLPENVIPKLKEGLGLSPDAPLIVNVNRNSPRKQIQYSFLAFKEFKKQVPNAVMYVHSKVLDVGGDLVRAIKYLGLSPQTDIIFPLKYSATNPISVAGMNQIYNAADIFLTTHLGEGWGLSQDPYTYINTTEGVRYLKDICIGDKVLTDSGQYEEVLDTTCREEPLVYELKPKFSPVLITSSLHPYLASKDDGKTLRWLNVKELEVGDYIAIIKPKDGCSILESQIDIADFVDCEKDKDKVWYKMGFSPTRAGLSILKVQSEFNISKRVAEDALNKFRGKEISSRCLPGSKAHKAWSALISKYDSQPLEPVKMNRFISIDDTFLEFIGWYLAEGSSENGVRVEISLHRKEKYIAERFRSWCWEVLGIKSTVEEFDNKSRLRISNSIFAKFLQQECGKGSYNKRIPSWLIESPTKLGPLLKGLVLGDGSFSKDGQIVLTTVSPSLAYQTRDICASVNILTAIRENKCRGNYIPYTVIFKHRNRFADYTGLNVIGEKRVIDCIDLREYFLVPIEGISCREDNTELLYDICVENTHSFVANGILAHNTITEAMAAGTPVVAPNNTSMPQQLGKNSERGYMYECKDEIWIDNSGFRPKGLVHDIVEQLLIAYNDGNKFLNPKVKIAREWAVKHDWNEVTKGWVELFAEVGSDNKRIITKPIGMMNLSVQEL